MLKIFLILMVLIASVIAYNGMTIKGKRPYCRISGTYAYCYYNSLKACYRSIHSDDDFCVIRGF